MKGCGALTPIKQILETILDPSRTHKCREKEKPTYKRKWAENKRKEKKKGRKKKKKQFKPQGEKVNFCFEGNVLGNV